MSEQILGKCPVCKEGDIVEKEKNFVCTEAKWEKDENEKWKNTGSCEFSIYKFGLEKLGKSEITAEEVKALIENGEVMVEFKKEHKVILDPKYGTKVVFF